EGTPLAGDWNLTPQRCLRILAMVRFVCPDVEVRLAGGREIHLRTLQPLALNLANSIFLGDYLTTEGQSGKDDLAMIADAGFEVEGTDTTTLPAHRADAAAAAGAGCGGHGGEGGGCGPCGDAAPVDAVPADAVPAQAAAGATVSAPAGTRESHAGLVAVRRRGAGTDLPPNA
ncbi:biotin synthase BioB, partial [Streptomyces sp. NPDC003442]